MREADIVRAILTDLRSFDRCFCWKEHGGVYGTAGIPDIICCYRGRFVAFEVKTETGRVTELQKAVLRRINEAGGTAIVVRSVQDVRDALAALNLK